MFETGESIATIATDSEIATQIAAIIKRGVLLDEKLVEQLVRISNLEESRLKQQREKDPESVQGMIATDLVDALLMASQLPQLVPSAANGKWAELGAGSAVTCIAMALCGRKVTGIERNPLLVKRAEQNKREIETATSKVLDLNFVEGRIPEEPTNSVSPELEKVLRESDVMYVYPWSHEWKNRVRLFQRYAKKGALLILYTKEEPVTFTVKEIEEMGLTPIKLPEGKDFGTLGLRLSNNS